MRHGFEAGSVVLNRRWLGEDNVAPAPPVNEILR